MAVLPRMQFPGDDNWSFWLELLALKASQALLDALGDSLAQYLYSSGRKLYVLGLSGGIDSSFLAALLYARGIPYRGFCLPLLTNAPEEIERGLAVSGAYASPLVGPAPLQDFSSVYLQISKTFAVLYPETTLLAEGNLKARLRMMFLYHAAQLEGGCVLGTDQLDEFLTGFWTLHGDVGDVSPLQFIPKTVEYELAAMLSETLENPAPLEAAIQAQPTDGLGITATDLEQLGATSYVQMEEMFRRYFTLKYQEEQDLSQEDKHELLLLEKALSVERFTRSRFKRSGSVMFDPRGI